MINVITRRDHIRPILILRIPLFQSDLSSSSNVLLILLILLRYMDVFHADQALEPPVRRLCEHLWGYLAVVVVLLGVHRLGDKEPRPESLLDEKGRDLQEEVEHEEGPEEPVRLDGQKVVLRHQEV